MNPDLLEEKKLVVFTHTDLDGVGSPVVAYWLYEDQVREVLKVDNKDVTTQLEDIISRKEQYDGHTLFICDHSPTLEMYSKLVESGLDFYVFDHHKSSELQELDDPRVTIDLTQCGTQLFFNWLIENDPELPSDRVESAQKFVYHVNDYDMWIHESPKSRELCQLFFELGWNRFSDRFGMDISMEFTPGENLLLQLGKEKVSHYVLSYKDKVVVHEDNSGDRYGVVFAESNTSELGHYLIREFGLKYVCMINARGLRCSLRGNGEIDVAEIAREKAKLYGTQSGGHKSAAGFTYNVEDLPDLIERLFKLNR